MRRTAPPSCPRCAYDLSGEVTRWHDQCPLAGTCPECGLELDWANVLNPTSRHVAGFVEHSRGVLPTITAAWRTWWWTVRPAAFWRRITLEAPLRPLRWFVWLLVVFVGSRIIASAFYAAAAAIEYSRQFANPIDLLVLLGDGALTTFFRGIADVRVGRYLSPTATGVPGTIYQIEWQWNTVPPFMYCVPLLMLLPPLTLLFMRGARRAAAVRTGHVLRAWVYSLSWLAVPLLLDVANALRVFTRCKTGSLILESYMPLPRSIPDWPRIITDSSIPIVVVLLGPLALWLTLWWWNAIHSWRLVRERRVMRRLATVWGFAVLFVLAAAGAAWAGQK